MIAPFKKLLASLLLGIVSISALHAQGGGSQFRFISDVTTIAPGEPFTIALQLTHPPEWHSYYINPGQVGTPPRIDWKLPDGFQAGEIQWPVPHLGQSLGNNHYGYEGRVHFLTEITPPDDLKLGEELTLTANCAWQICDENGCIGEPDPAMAGLDFSVKVKTASESVENSRTSRDFELARSQLPIDSDSWEITAYNEGQAVIINLKPRDDQASALEGLYFFSADNQFNGQLEQEFRALDDGTYELKVIRAKEDFFYEKVVPGPSISGILKSDIGWVKGDPRTGLTVDEVMVGSPPAKAAEIGNLLGILGGMFLGGLILNLMPCVFPVIGLKIMGFVEQAGGDRKKIIIHGVVFAIGVLVSFWIISGILLSLREAAIGGGGEEVGWGYQLQNPWVVYFLTLLMLGLALNMYGVYEFGLRATGVGGSLVSKQGIVGSFFSGVLATIVATPCSGPFLGVAIGAAFRLPSFQFMLAFTFMALGLAFPYLLLSMFPSLVKKLPRPGPWMESLKQGMALLLFATTGFLLWVYVGQVGLNAMLNVVLGLSAIATALWIYGRWFTLDKRPRTRAIAAVFAVLIGGWGAYAALPKKESEDAIKWVEWSAEEVERHLEEGTPVYVDFTAQWCLTCQVNKRNAYNEEVSKMFKTRGIVAMKADKTNPSPDIDAKLQELGRTAIPVNVLYVPGGDEPIITREVLSPQYLLDLLDEHLGEKEIEISD